MARFRFHHIHALLPRLLRSSESRDLSMAVAATLQIQGITEATSTLQGAHGNHFPKETSKFELECYIFPHNTSTFVNEIFIYGTFSLRGSFDWYACGTRLSGLGTVGLARR